MQPREFQARAIERVGQAFRDGKTGVVLVSPTGSGKTFCGSYMVRALVERGKRIAWGAHRQELVDQAADTLRNMGVEVGTNGYRSWAPVQIGTYQTWVRRGDAPEADYFVADECVSGNTMIGSVRAAHVSVGDLVPSMADGRTVMRRVVRRFVNVPRSLLTIYASGHALTVTSNHPVWINGRYIPAGLVQVGDVCAMRRPNKAVCERDDAQDMLRGLPRHCGGVGGIQGDPWRPSWPAKAYTASAMPELRQADSSDEGSWLRLASNMLGSVPSRHLFGNDGRHQPAGRVRANEGAESDAPSVHQGRGLEDAMCNGPSTYVDRRQRPRTNGTPALALAGAGLEVVAGVPDQDWWGSRAAIHRIHRHSQPFRHDRDRGGRNLAWHDGVEGARQEKDGVLALARVDRVEVHQQTPDGTFGGRAPDGLVYNFEVEGEHNYFANEILTHNCHHLADKTGWTDIQRAYKNGGKKCIGLTATPARGDGQALPLFDHIVVAAQVRELQALGLLVPLRIKRSPRKYAKDRIAQTPCAAYQEWALGRSTVVFAPHIKAAEAFRDEFRGAGIPCTLVTGAMPDDERRDALLHFNMGTTPVLINVAVLCEGWDAPRCSCVILGRGCGSQALYIQMVGRALRPHESKTDALLIDLRGVSYDLGRPDEDREFSLDGEGIKLARQSGIPRDRACKICHEPLGEFVICPNCGTKNALVIPRATGADLVDWDDSYDEAKAVKPVNRLILSLAGMFRKAKSHDQAVARFRHIFKFHPSAQQIADAHNFNRTITKTHEARLREVEEAR